MGVQIYTTAERDIWHNYLDRLEDKDIYFTPEYGKVHELNGEGEATLFLYEDGEDFIYYPFLKRNLNELPHVKSKVNLHGELFDITTPYGYGGPISNIQNPDHRRKVFEDFSEAFQQYCQQERIVTEFIRFHPLIANQSDYTALDTIYLRNTIHVDLTKEEDEIWAHYDSPNRNRIRKARKNGLEVVHRSLDNRSDFLRIYYATMDKNQASSYYYFSEDYFNHKANLLGKNAELFEVMYKGKVIFSGIFMNYGDFIHYDLVGSDLDYLKFCPNNFVIDYAARWAKTKGMKYLHLGGGYAGNDNLFRFKKRFNKYGERPFYIGKKVHDENLYHRLTDGLGQGNGFFPMYRDPSIIERKATVVG